MEELAVADAVDAVLDNLDRPAGRGRTEPLLRGGAGVEQAASEAVAVDGQLVGLPYVLRIDASAITGSVRVRVDPRAGDSIGPLASW